MTVIPYDINTMKFYSFEEQLKYCNDFPACEITYLAQAKRNVNECFKFRQHDLSGSSNFGTQSLLKSGRNVSDS